MAADDCVKSQDSSTDSLPVDMQQLKEHVEKALKKPLIKEETWWDTLKPKKVSKKTLAYFPGKAAWLV